MKFIDRIRLASLRGREQTLGRQIASGYARGKYLPKLRSEQQEVRAQIRRMTQG